MIIDELIITFKNVNKIKYLFREFSLDIVPIMILKSQVDTKYSVLFIFNRNNLMIIINCIYQIIGDLLTFENIKKYLVVQCNNFAGKNKMYFFL
jgi:hypothetical protein